MNNKKLDDVSRTNEGETLEQLDNLAKLAYKCGFIDKDYRCDNKFCGDLEDLEKFASAIRAEEREACAKIADVTSWGGDAADLIRARSAAPKDEVSNG